MWIPATVSLVPYSREGIAVRMNVLEALQRRHTLEELEDLRSTKAAVCQYEVGKMGPSWERYARGWVETTDTLNLYSSYLC